MQVFKFGGASIKDAAGIKNLAHIVQKYPANNLLIDGAAGPKIVTKIDP